jgi:hypothetical protein
MAQYPARRDHLWQVWPTLPIDQRVAKQQQWAAEMEPSFLAASCDMVELQADLAAKLSIANSIGN